MAGIRFDTCPICGEKVSYIERRKIGNRVYLYSVHVKREGKKRTVKKCYLGKETKYLYLLETGQEKASIPETDFFITERIKISKDELNDIILYYDKRDTKGMTKERRDRARELFKKVFSSGKKIVEVEG